MSSSLITVLLVVVAFVLGVFAGFVVSAFIYECCVEMEEEASSAEQ